METVFSHNTPPPPPLPHVLWNSSFCPAIVLYHQSVASEEFGEESSWGRPVRLGLLFDLGLLVSQAQFPLQLLQLRLVQQLKVLHLAVRLLGQLQQPGGLPESGPIRVVARCREADRCFYSLLDGSCNRGGDEVSRHLVDQFERFVVGSVFVRRGCMLGFGWLLGLRWRQGKAEVIVVVAIGRSAVVEWREFLEATDERFLSVEVCEVEVRKGAKTFTTGYSGWMCCGGAVTPDAAPRTSNVK